MVIVSGASETLVMIDLLSSANAGADNARAMATTIAFRQLVRDAVSEFFIRICLGIGQVYAGPITPPAARAPSGIRPRENGSTRGGRAPRRDGGGSARPIGHRPQRPR